MTKAQFETVTFFKSSNFSLFNFFTFNRVVDNNHVKTLMASMTERGFSGAILVIKTSIFDGVERYYILDGQHRYSAAKALDIPFTFEVVNVDTEIELARYIADVNNSSKAWGTNQFLEVWADMKINEYIKLKQVKEETGIQLTPLIEAYTGQSRMVEFRKGTMKFPNESESDTIIQQLMDFKDVLPTKAFCRRTIIRLMRDENYNHSLIKPFVFKQSKNGGFTENEKELRAELTTLIKLSHRVKILN